MRRVVLAATSLALALGTVAYVRSTTQDKGAGCPLYWGTRQLTVAVNAGGTRVSGSTGGGCDPAATVAAIDASFQTWAAASPSGSAPCTDLRFTMSMTSDTSTGFVRGGPNTNLVVWRQGLCGEVVPTNDPCRRAGAAQSCANAYDCWDHDDGSVIALTTTTFNADTGEILDADTEFFGWDGKSPAAGSALPGSSAANAPQGGPWYFTCVPAPGADVMGVVACSDYGEARCAATDVQNTMTHEAGHFLGLAHSPYPGATMYSSSDIGDLAKRLLSRDDVEGVCSIYPRGEPTATCRDPAGSSGSGCRTAGPSEGALLLLVLLALRARGPLRR